MTAPFTPSELRAAPDLNVRNAVIVARAEELKLQPKLLIKNQKKIKNPSLLHFCYTAIHMVTVQLQQSVAPPIIRKSRNRIERWRTARVIISVTCLTNHSEADRR